MKEGQRLYYVRASSIVFDSRATKEIRTFLDNGLKVVVIGWNRDGIDAKAKCVALFDNNPNVEFRFFEQDMKTIIGVRNLRQVLGWFSFVKRNIQKCDGCEAIHACDLICGLPAKKKAKKLRIPLVYDIFDYYVDTHMPKQPMRMFIEKQEISIINFAAVTIICTEERAVQLRKARPKATIVIHNAPNLKNLPIVPPEYDYCYFGAMGPTRLTWEILTKYPLHSNLKICFGGTGEQKCVDLARKLDKEFANFTYLGQVSYATVLEIESKTVVLSAIYDPTNINNRLCAPNKFYESLALGKPMIVCKGTAIEAIVLENGLGRAIDYSGDQFYESLASLLDDKRTIGVAKTQGRFLFEQKYSWELMAQRLIGIYDSLLQK